MSAELTEAERANQLAHAIYATGALNLPLSDRIDVDCHDAARAVIGSGWVSPEEAKAREAAARREALPDVEAVAASVHDAWMEAKRSQGVTSRPSEWGEEQMVPYADLSERAKDLDRATVRSVYAAIERSES